jgi:hypothetical protein
MPRRGGGQWDPQLVENAPRYHIRVPRKGGFFDFHYMTINDVNYTQVLCLFSVRSSSMFTVFTEVEGMCCAVRVIGVCVVRVVGPYVLVFVLNLCVRRLCVCVYLVCVVLPVYVSPVANVLRLCVRVCRRMCVLVL